MKMLYFSVALMLALLGATAYLAMQARDEAVKANNKMDLFTQQQRAVAAQNVEVQMPPPVAEPPVSAAPPAPAPVVAASRPAGSEPVAPPPAKPVTAAAGSPAGTDAPTPPPVAAPLTPTQRLVKSAPSIGKVKEFIADQGFVVLSAGSKQNLKQGQKFDLRREASVVGRITISSADEAESIADLDPRSVPAGVTVQPGDEIISTMQH